MKKLNNEEKNKKNKNFKIQPLGYTSNSKFQILNSKLHSGITLVALVVTIVVLLILAGITINFILGPNSIFDLARKAGEETNKAVAKERGELGNLINYINEQGWGSSTGGNGDSSSESTVKITGISFVPNTAEVTIGSTVTLMPVIEPANASNKNLKWTSLNTDIAVVDNNGVVTPVKAGTATIKAEATDESGKFGECTVTVKNVALADLTSSTEFLTEPKEVKDINNNKVVIPDGFRVLANGTKNEDIDEVVYSYDEESHTPCVQDGIVIADRDNNQFVWIPVGTINNKKDDSRGATTTITLGRYSKWGASPTVEQTQKNYTEEKVISSTFYESINQTGENSHAANLKNFIDNGITNGGYWFGRYEASYGEGYNSNGSKYQNAKPLSVISKAASEKGMSYTKGVLWNFITQKNASIVAQNMKKTGTYKSDLINSYSWDTAIQFIERYAQPGYANQNTLSRSLNNTGKIGDKWLNIHDMASNCYEWSTEYSTFSDQPYVCRGGDYTSSYYCTTNRGDNMALTNSNISFRCILY